MTWYLVLFVAFFLLGLLLRFKRSIFHGLAENSVAVVDKLLADLDDQEKIKLVQKHTNSLVLSLFSTISLLVLSLLLAAIPIAIFILFTKLTFQELDFLSWKGILALSLGATLPFIIPLGNKKTSDYPELSQLLHRMSLDNYYLSYKLFKNERKRFQKKNIQKREDFIIVSGLARSGTTSLMNDLSRIEGFATLSYANMPFLLSPNTWRRFYKPKPGQQKERSHKDGIMIGLDSNEALEEYFFKVKARDSYIQSQHLLEYDVPEADYQDYLDYQLLVRKNDSRLYLAKNNNFILRYKSLRAYNDKFLMLILYRDPIAHASSLLEKHQEYSAIQASDPFVLEYMNWLGHHEFGLGQKTFKFSDSDAILASDKDHLDYWLYQWINYYTFAMNIQDSNTHFINYSSYCLDPGKVVETILNKVGYSTELPKYGSFINDRKPSMKFSANLFTVANRIFEALNKRQIKWS